ncbi:hypothetical protein LJC49_03575 [Ruminococcaceae bacterium OttesenSCG-928-I18]|nr:hypothetical protein [Ruminococcaceae bacterium OttesenSCG-928-I18]
MNKVLAIVAAMALCTSLLAACGGGDAPASSSAALASSAPASSAAPSSSKAPASTPAATSGTETDTDATEGEEMYSVDFELINSSNAALVDIRLSPTGDEDWGDNILTEEVPDGSSIMLVSDVVASADTTFDMYTMDSDGDEYVYTEVPLTELSVLELFVEVDEDGNYMNDYVWE